MLTFSLAFLLFSLLIFCRRRRRRHSYDDMLDDYCSDNAETCPAPPGLFKFGAWVNGGQWSTQEGRMLMAYWRTGRAQVTYLVPRSIGAENVVLNKQRTVLVRLGA